MVIGTCCANRASYTPTMTRKTSNKDLTGKTFNRLTAIKALDKRSGTSIVWECRCSCGNICEAASHALSRATKKSCGCIMKERNWKKYPEYQIWGGMNSRCSPNASGHNYIHYYSNGIRVCERWKGRGKFMNFLEDVGRRPSKLHSLDRINPKGDYEPSNVRWATALEQVQNRTIKRIEDFSDEEFIAEALRRGMKISQKKI